MLEAIRKKFFATQKEEVEMSDPTKQEVAAKELVEAVADTEMSSALAAATELNASQAAALAEQAALVAELTAKFEAAQAALAEIESAKAALIAEAAEAKLTARKEKVVEMIGTERADALLSATASMDDNAFDAVLIAMSVGSAKEADSVLFKEVGVAGEVEASKVDEDPVARLSAKLAAQFNPK